MKRLGNFIGKWIIRARWWLFAITMKVSGLSSSGMRRLTFDNGLQVISMRNC